MRNTRRQIVLQRDSFKHVRVIKGETGPKTPLLQILPPLIDFLFSSNFPTNENTDECISRFDL